MLLVLCLVILLLGISTFAQESGPGKAEKSLNDLLAGVAADAGRGDAMGLTEHLAHLRAHAKAHPGERVVYEKLAPSTRTITEGLPDDPAFLPPWHTLLAIALEPGAMAGFADTEEKIYTLERQATMARHILDVDFASRRRLFQDQDGERVTQLEHVCAFLAAVRAGTIPDYRAQESYLNGLSPQNLKALSDMGVVYHPGTPVDSIEQLEARNLVARWMAENRQRNLDNQFQRALHETIDGLQPRISRFAKPILTGGGKNAERLLAALRSAGLPER